MGVEKLEILLDSELAKVAKEKGLLEVVFRNADARYKSFVKCNFPDASEKALEKALEAASSKVDVKNIRKQLNSLRNASATMSKKMDVFMNSFDNVSNSLATLGKATSVLKAVSYINIGLTCINIITDVAGFMYVSSQINEVKKELAAIDKNVVALKNIEMDKLLEQYNGLSLKILNLCQKIADKEEVALTTYEDLLAELNPFMLKLVDHATDEAMPLMDLMNIVIHLLPTYTILVSEYTKAYYNEKGKIPVIQKQYVNVYDALDGDKLLKKIQDHVFLNEKQHFRDAIDVVNMHELMVFSQKQQLDDTNKLLESGLTKEQLQKIDEAIDKYATTTANQQFAYATT